MEDIDDVSFVEYDNWERLKAFDAKEGTTVGDTPVIPTEDNDQKLYFYDTQAESVYTNPPDGNQPIIDHGLDEEKIWAFNSTGFNQSAIKNSYSRNLWESTKQTHAPFWGQKLMTPAFYKAEKLPKFYNQWTMRLKLEIIKMRHSLIAASATPQQKRMMKEEIEQFINHAYEQGHQDELADVYVTNHEQRTKKFTTASQKEDEQFFRYKQALQQYN